MKHFITLSTFAFAGLCAEAQACTVNSFSSKNGAIYLEAETALLQEHDPQEALALSDTLFSSELNCYERQAVRKLRAAIYVELGEHTNAAMMLIPLVSDKSLSASERSTQAHNIGQIFLAAGDEKAGSKWLKMSKDIASEGN
ncbi:hypothetical protein [Henriciella sp.]|uniref:hypothetical protein n=1 Tax=Henriciella sp. TaxID=1968823 RepID=UPI0026147BDA|nr:hypothetical protein [Henriciella sp.]